MTAENQHLPPSFEHPMVLLHGGGGALSHPENMAAGDALCVRGMLRLYAFCPDGGCYGSRCRYKEPKWLHVF